MQTILEKVLIAATLEAQLCLLINENKYLEAEKILASYHRKPYRLKLNYNQLYLHTDGGVIYEAKNVRELEKVYYGYKSVVEK